MSSATTLTVSQQTLAEEYLPLAMSIARRHAKKCPSLSDDFEEACQIRICELARDWIPESGVYFATYARQRLEWACMDVVRSKARHATGPGSVHEMDPDRLRFVPGIGGDPNLSVMDSPETAAPIENDQLQRIAWIESQLVDAEMRRAKAKTEHREASKAVGEFMRLLRQHTGELVNPKPMPLFDAQDN